MAKIEKKSKNEPKKKATKSATLKCRTTSARTKKPSGGVKAKTVATAKAVSQPKKTGKATKTVATKKTASAKSAAAVKKSVPQTKASPLSKRTVTKTTTAVKTLPKSLPTTRRSGKPQVKHKPVISEHPLERKMASAEELRVMLLERRNGILKNIDDEISTPQEFDPPKVVVGDMADLAQGSSEHELSFRLAEVESRELGQINIALEKINEGTYGVCEKCDGLISSARLKALPFASKCIRCQEEEERENF